MIYNNYSYININSKRKYAFSAFFLADNHASATAKIRLNRV